MMERAANRGKPVIMKEALNAIRRRFPNLAVSNKDLTAGVMGEAIAAGAMVVFDSEPLEPSGGITPSPTANAALKRFFDSYNVGGRAFAVSDALRAVRQLVPESDLSNNDLLSAIAAAGTTGRLNIAFDVPKARPKAAEIAEWDNEGGSISQGVL
jgi:hypothetical protein